MAIMNAETGAQFNIDVWSNEVLRFYKRKLLWTEHCTDVSGWAIGKPRGFYTMEIPTTTLLGSVRTAGGGITAASTTGVSYGDTAITYDANTDSKITLTIDQYFYQGIQLTEWEDVMAGYDMMAEYAPAVAENIARKIDSTKAGLVDDLTYYTGTLTEDPTEDDLLYCIQVLDDLDVPEDNRQWIVSNAAWAGLMKMNRLTSIEYVERKPLVDGEIRNLYGYPCRQNNNLDGTNAAGHDNFFGRKSWAGYVHALRPKIHKMDDIDILMEKMVTTAIWGDKILRATDAVWLKGP